MRTITITFTENPAKDQTETWVDFGDPAKATTAENNRLKSVMAPLAAVLSAGADGFAAGDEGIDELRKKAAVGSDIRRAGQ